MQKNEPDLWEQIVTRQYQLPEQHAIEEAPFTDGADGSDITVEAIAKHIADGEARRQGHLIFGGASAHVLRTLCMTIFGRTNNRRLFFIFCRVGHVTKLWS